jgi:imidazolonepropionase
MKSADLLIANCRQILTCRGPIPKRKEDLDDVGLIEDASIASHKGRIVFVGREERFREDFSL